MSQCNELLNAKIQLIAEREKKIVSLEETARTGFRDQHNAWKQELELEVQTIRSEAKAEALNIITRAQESALLIEKEAADSAAAARAEIDEKGKNTAQEIRRLEYLRAELEEDAGWLDEQKRKIREQQEELQAREAACAGDRVIALEARNAELLGEYDALWKEHQRLRRESQVDMLGSLVEERDSLAKKLATLQSEHAHCPDPIEAQALEDARDLVVRSRARCEELQALLHQELNRTEMIQDVRLEVQKERRERERLRILNEYWEQENNALLAQIDEISKSTRQPFDGFSIIDAEDVKESRKRKNATLALDGVVTSARNWMAKESSPRFYSAHTISAFLAGLAASRLVILQGVSGTGKTSLPMYFADAIGARHVRVEVQSSWRDRADLLGFFNAFHGKFNATEFARALYEAGSNRWKGHPFFIILDEANLSRIEYYFADLLSIMEGRQKGEPSVELLGHDPTRSQQRRPENKEDETSTPQLPRRLISGEDGVIRLPIPNNVWFVATINKDESTNEITKKVYDRASVLELEDVENMFSPHELARTQDIDHVELRNAFERAVEEFPKKHRDSAVGALEIVVEEIKENFGLGFGRRIFDQLSRFLPVYFAAGGNVRSGLDHFLARKVLWQVCELRNPNAAEKLQKIRNCVSEFLEPLGGDTGGSPSDSLLHREIERLN